MEALLGVIRFYMMPKDVEHLFQENFVLECDKNIAKLINNLVGVLLCHYPPLFKSIPILSCAWIGPCPAERRKKGWQIPTVSWLAFKEML